MTYSLMSHWGMATQFETRDIAEAAANNAPAEYPSTYALWFVVKINGDPISYIVVFGDRQFLVVA